jgi:CRP/FNR family cyclic AMP-dependent transcriptional regulator
MANGNLGQWYAKGHIVVRQGEIGDNIFAIQEGELEVVKERQGGGEIRVAVLQAGDIFGEMAILEKEQRNATVRTLTDARLLTVDKKTFMSRVHEDPSLAFNILRMMAKRIRALNAKLGERRGRVDRRKVERRSVSTRRKGPRRTAA